jgi:hypothetical protein
MRHLVTTFIIVSLAAAGALAQVDPGPDGIGIYFDESATLTSLAVPMAGGEPAPLANAWLVAIRPTVTGDVGYWQAWVESSPPGGLPNDAAPVYGWPTFGHNIDMNMPGDPRRHFTVFIDQGLLLTRDVVVLARLQVWCATAQPIPLYVRDAEIGVYGWPARPLAPSSGAWERPVAMINGQAPVAAESASWGDVKSLFR